MDLQSIEAQAQEFGERVRAAREKKGISRAELAELAGISRPYLWQLEDGRSKPSLDYAVRIASALDVSVAQLVGEERREPHPATVRIQESIPEAGRIDGALKFFWTFLSIRAIATQKAYRYDKRNFSLDGEYRIILDYFDKVIRRGEIQDDCAMLAIEAVKLENAARINGDQPDEKKLQQAIETWMDAERLGERRERKEATIAVKWSLGNALNVQYRDDWARERLEHVRVLMGDEPSELSMEDIAGLYTTLGWINYYLASFYKAIERFQEAEQKWKMVSVEESCAARYEGLATTYRGLGSTYQRMDEFQKAEQAFNKMLEAAESLAEAKNGSSLHLVWGKFRIGNFYKHAGDWPRADEYLTQADELWADLDREGKIDYGLQLLKTMILNNRADLLIQKGIDDGRAQKDLEESLSIGKRVRDKRAVAFSHWFLAGLSMARKECDKALLHLDLSEREFEGMRIQRYLWSVQIYKARVYCGKGLTEAAESLIKQIVTSRMEGPSHRAQVLATQGFVYACNQRYEEAKKAFEESIPALEILPYEATTARLDYAEMLTKIKEVDQAREQLNLAQQAAGKLGANGLLERAKGLLQEIQAT